MPYDDDDDDDDGVKLTWSKMTLSAVSLLNVH